MGLWEYYSPNRVPVLIRGGVLEVVATHQMMAIRGTLRWQSEVHSGRWQSEVHSDDGNQRYTQMPVDMTNNAAEHQHTFAMLLLT